MVLEQILFFIAAIGALAGALGVVVLRNPFYSVLSLVGAPDRAGDALPAAARRVPRGRAGRRLRGRRDGPVRLRRRLRRRRRGAARAASAETVGALGVVFAGALLVEIMIAVIGSGLTALDTRGAARGRRASARRPAIGQLLLQQLPRPVRGGVVPAARRRGRRGRARPPPARARGARRRRAAGARRPRSRSTVPTAAVRAEPSVDDATRVPAGTAEGRDDPTVASSATADRRCAQRARRSSPWLPR